MPVKPTYQKLVIVLEMIKFEHTVFALPFAFLGAFLAARGLPEVSQIVWILLAMVGARSAAMAFNRLIDQKIDGLNPRTADRALPARLLSSRFVWVFVLASSVLFVFAAYMLNRLAFLLSPLALLIVLGYSYTKRFTVFSHLALGIALGIAPVGGWIAVAGTFPLEALILMAAVMFWVGGFDIIYSCQDADFDREVGLFSIPGHHGVRWALNTAVIFHVSMIGLLVWAFYLYDLSVVSWIGLLFVTMALVYEHSLVKAEDLSRVNAAFFLVNGLVSIVLFLFVGIDLCLFA